jgi:hypothetical protein
MALMHCTNLRFDDAKEGQLDDVLHWPDAIDNGIFGSKTDQLAEG